MPVLHGSYRTWSFNWWMVSGSISAHPDKKTDVKNKKAKNKRKTLKYFLSFITITTPVKG
ncbi:MAG: hypothetical protein M1458_02790 [Deltaproteobacteria bacterium]|nr:hypothetical protein [Deltaproteobacteria bacterium]